MVEIVTQPKNAWGGARKPTIGNGQQFPITAPFCASFLLAQADFITPTTLNFFC